MKNYLDFNYRHMDVPIVITPFILVIKCTFRKNNDTNKTQFIQ